MSTPDQTAQLPMPNADGAAMPTSPPTTPVVVPPDFGGGSGSSGGPGNAEPGPGRQPRRRGTVAATTITVVCLAIITLSLVVLAVFGVISALNPFGSETVDRSGPAVLESIRDLQEFTAAEGTFIQDVDIEEDASWLPSFISGQRVVALVTGTVRATVDFSGLADDAITVSDDGTSININLPEPVLSDADIDETSARIVSRDRGLIDRFDDFFAENPVDDTGLFVAAEKKVEAAARETDLLGEAKANTEEWLTSFLRAAGFETVVVSWDRAPG